MHALTMRYPAPGFRWCQLALGFAWVATVAPIAMAQVPHPKLDGVFPLGLRAGDKTDLTIDGQHLDETERLIFSHPGITATPAMSQANGSSSESRAVGGKFIVSVAAQVPRGVYEVRALGPLGISNACPVAVGHSAELAEREPNDQPAQAMELPLEAVVNGRCDARGFDCYKLSPASGQRLILHCVSRRLGSRAHAVMALFEATGREITRSRDTGTGDAIIDFTAPTAGPYIVKVFDFVYGGGEQYAYRFRATSGPWIDYIDPPVIRVGSAHPVTVYGRNLPGGQPVNSSHVAIQGLQKLSVNTQAIKPEPGVADVQDILLPAAAGLDFFAFRLPGMESDPHPVLVADGPVLREAEPNNDPAHAQKIPIPCDIVGRFNVGGDVDLFTFEATKGQVLAVELYSQRLGAVTDPSIVIQHISADGKAQTVQESDDSAAQPADKNPAMTRYPVAHGDPALLFTATKDGPYRLLVRDLYASEGDPRDVYWLAVHAPRPGFSLVAFPYQPPPIMQGKKQVEVAPGATVLLGGGTEPVMVQVLREPGFTGQVTIAAQELPTGVTAQPIIVPAWRSHGVLMLRTAGDAPAWTGPLRIVGQSDSAQSPPVFAHGAQVSEEAAPNTPVRAHLVGSFYAAIAQDYSAPLAVEAGEAKTYETAAGSKLQLPIKLIKASQLKGEFTLTPTDLPPTIQAPPVKLSESQPQQTLDLTIDKSAPPGAFSFYLQGQANVVYQRQIHAQQDLPQIEGAKSAVSQRLASPRKSAAAREISFPVAAGPLTLRITPPVPK